MIWRTCGSLNSSSARSAYSTRAVGLVAPAATRPRYWGVSASSRSSRSPRASLVAVPSDGMRSPRVRREIVEWSTPDCWASWRCDIFLALSCARSHSLNARPFWLVIVGGELRDPQRGCCRDAETIPAGPFRLYHPFVRRAARGAAGRPVGGGGWLQGRAGTEGEDAPGGGGRGGGGRGPPEH